MLICRTAVTLLQTKCNVTVVGDDTDLLVILIDMTRNLRLNRWKIFLSTKTNIYDLKSVITSLGVKGARNGAAELKMLPEHLQFCCSIPSRGAIPLVAFSVLDKVDC